MKYHKSAIIFLLTAFLAGCGPTKKQDIPRATGSDERTQTQAFRKDVMQLHEFLKRSERDLMKLDISKAKNLSLGGAVVHMLLAIAVADAYAMKLETLTRTIHLDGMPSSVIDAHAKLVDSVKELTAHQIMTAEEIEKLRAVKEWDEIAHAIMYSGPEYLNHSWPDFSAIYHRVMPRGIDELTKYFEAYATSLERVEGDLNNFGEVSHKYHGLESLSIAPSTKPSTTRSSGASSSGAGGSMETFLDKYEETVNELERVDWSRMGVAEITRIAAAQMEMAAEAQELQDGGVSMTPAELRRYGRLTERLTNVMMKAQSSIK
jgi:hypothetical protein